MLLIHHDHLLDDSFPSISCPQCLFDSLSLEVLLRQYPHSTERIDLLEARAVENVLPHHPVHPVSDKQPGLSPLLDQLKGQPMPLEMDLLHFAVLLVEHPVGQKPPPAQHDHALHLDVGFDHLVQHHSIALTPTHLQAGSVDPHLPQQLLDDCVPSLLRRV